MLPCCSRFFFLVNGTRPSAHLDVLVRLQVYQRSISIYSDDAMMKSIITSIINLKSFLRKNALKIVVSLKRVILSRLNVRFCLLEQSFFSYASVPILYTIQKQLPLSFLS